jgi:hypothetical protein
MGRMSRPNILGVEMEYVEIPLQIAQRAMRVYRPLVPYVRKRVSELRQAGKETVTEIIPEIAPDEILKMIPEPMPIEKPIKLGKKKVKK